MEDDFLEELSSILSGKPVAKKAPAVRRSEYDPLFEKYGRQYGVDPDLLRAQTSQESGFNPRARSHANAQGLMQLIPATAQRFGVKDVWDPEQNISGGAQYMRWLLDRFDGDVDKALAGYNAGEGAVDKYNGIPPYRETQDYVKRIRANYRGTGRTDAGPALDVRELTDILSGQQPAVDVEELKNILGGTAEEADAKKKLGLPTGTEPTVPEGTYVQPPSPLDLGVPAYKPEEVKTTVTPTPSIPNPEIPPKVEKPNRLAPPPATPTKQVAKKKPEVPSEEGFSVSVEPGAYTVVDPSQGVMVDAGVQVDMAPRQVGKGTDDLNRQVAAVKVDLRGVEGNKGEYAVRRAYESIAGTYGLTPEMIDKAVTLRANTWGSGRDRAIDPNAEEGTVSIALKDIADLKGEKEAVTDERIRQVQARPVLEELPPEELFNKWNPEDIELIAGLNKPRDDFFKQTDSGNALIDLMGGVNKNLAAGVIGSGGRTMDAVTGLYRLANEVFTGRGTRDRVLSLSGNKEKIKAFRTDDLELAMREIADIAKRPGAELEKTNNYFGSVVQLAGGLPGDLSRVMFMSANPGGIVLGMSADMALQSAGRGESIDKVGMEAFKGALFGGIARLAGPVGQKWATNLADMGVKPLASKLGGGAAAMGFTAAGTYPLSRAFGADPKTALRETLFNTLFAVADTLPALTTNTGRTIRVSDTEGNSLTVLLDRKGEIKEVQLPKDQPADMEIMDPAIAEKRKEYIKVAESATDMLSVERSRPFVDRLREAEFTRDGDAVAMNPQAVTILQNILEYTTRNSNRPFSASDDGFRGITLDKDIAGSLVRGVERMRDEVLSDGDTVQGIELNEFLIKFEGALKDGNNEGAFYTKFEEPEYENLSLADKDEELLHLQGVRSGLSDLLNNGLPNTPVIDRIRKQLAAKYQERDTGYQYNEAVAQIFRRDADAHLGTTKQELRAARQELFRALEQVEDFDHTAFAGALEGVNRTGKAYARYHKQVSGRGTAEPSRPADEPARTEASSPAVRSVQDAGTGSLGDSGRSDGRNVPEQFRDRRDLVPEPTAAEVTQPGLEVPIGKPTKETLQPWAPPAVPEGKAAPEVGDFVTIGGTGGKPYMIRDITPDGMARLDDAANPFENALIDIPVRELEIYQKVAEKDTTPGVVDEVDVRDSEGDARFEEAMRDDSRVANAGGAKLLTPEPKQEATPSTPTRPTPEQAAVDQMVAEALPAPKADYNFINPERQTYLLSIANSKDAKITTAKVGGKDVTFLSNKKAKVMLQPEEVPFVETALKDKEIDPQLAHLWQGSRHLYNPEILVEYPDGRQEYIEGKQKRFPAGTRVSRRGDGAVIVKYDKVFNLTGPNAKFVPMLDGKVVGYWKYSNDVRTADDAINHMVANELQFGRGPSHKSTWSADAKEFADGVRERTKGHIEGIERDLANGIDPVTGDPVDVPELTRKLQAYKKALEVLNSDRFKVGDSSKREVLNTKDILPEVPAGAKLVKEFPLGRIRNDKIGTGEGAQVYGYGHYAAEKKGTAEYYRTAGMDDDGLGLDFFYKGEKVDAAAGDMENALAYEVFEMAYRFNNGDYQKAIDNAILEREVDIDTLRDDLEYLKDSGQTSIINEVKNEILSREVELEFLREFDEKDFNDDYAEGIEGHLYRLKSNVPDEKTLRYDDKLTDQPEPVKQVADKYYNLKRINNGIPVLKEGEVLDTVGDGQDFYNKLKGEKEFDPNAEVLSGVKGYIYSGKQAASLHLKKRGIGGLKFEDRASRGMQVTSKTLYKGQSPYYVQGLNSLEQGAIETVIDGINDDGVSPQQAINDAIGFYKNNLKDPDILEESADYFSRTIDFLKTLDPNDFQVQKVNKTYNHVIFDGADIDVTRIFFASEFKKQKIYDKAKQDEILEFSNEHFPYLASLWRRPAGSGSPVPGLNQAAKEARQAARGLDELTLPQRVAQSVVKIYHQFTRQFEAINPNESVQMARVGDSFRLLSNLNQWAKTQAMNDVARVTADMDRSQMDIFEDVLILRDQQNAGEQGKPLNFGYKDLKEVEADLKIAEAAAAADPVISKALSDREKLRVETVRGLVKIGMLGDGALKNTRYYHRQVPQGADGNLFLSVGSKDIRVRKKGFQKERKGSITDPNTNYVESEVEWISQAHAQIRKTELLNEVKRAIDISGDLKAQAKIQGIKDWTELIPRTHRIWQPQEGSYFYEVMTVPDMLITDIFAGRHSVKSATAEMKKAFAAGQRKPEWVLPVEIANLMDDFQLQLPEGEVSNVAAKANASWKQWQLINPKNVGPYNIRNMVSDLDVAMAYPGVLKELPGAIQDVWKYSRDKRTAAAAEIEQAIRDGVMDSGITFAEIPDISKTGIFKRFADSDTSAISKSVRAAWDLSKGATNARENWIRLAAYRHMKKQLDAGKTIYGASTPMQVDAMAYDKGRQAAKLARELVGDYGGISSAGRTIRKHMIPFYSWLEINAPRYVRLIKNAPLEGRSRSTTVLGGAARGAASTVRLGVKLTLLTAGINVWNHAVFPEVEEKLMKTDIGRRPHIILGENEDGTVRIFQADTALRDMLDWVDAGDTVADIADIMSGKSTLTDKLAEAVKAPVNKVVQGLGPQYKLPAELYTGESAFPSVFEKGSSFSLKSRPIRDRMEHLAQTFAVKGIYQRVTGRPQPPSTGPVGTALDWFLTNRIDPAESIFWNVKSKVSDYRKKMGKSSPGGDYDDRSNTLFYYKQAIKWNDQMAAERYLKQYKEEFGGDEASLKQSITKTHPLGGMAKADWPEFIKTLRPEELDQLKIAIDYYNNKFMYGEKGTPAENTTVDEVMQMLFPGKTAADIDSMIEIERRKDEAGARKKAIKAERLATP